MTRLLARNRLLIICLAFLATGCVKVRKQEADLSQLSPLAARFPHYADEAVRVEKSSVTVQDGDTFSAGGQVIRVLGLDTPEIAHPNLGWRKGQPFGEEARERAEELLEGAQVIEYLPAEKDRYGRLLAQVFLDGELLAVIMIGEHLGWETVSTYGDNGFPDLAALVVAAADRAGEPPFMEPYKWRQLQREGSPAGAGRR